MHARRHTGKSKRVSILFERIKGIHRKYEKIPSEKKLGVSTENARLWTSQKDEVWSINSKASEVLNTNDAFQNSRTYWGKFSCTIICNENFTNQTETTSDFFEITTPLHFIPFSSELEWNNSKLPGVYTFICLLTRREILKFYWFARSHCYHDGMSVWSLMNIHKALPRFEKYFSTVAPNSLFRTRSQNVQESVKKNRNRVKEETHQ